MIPPTVIVGVGGQGSAVALQVKERLIEYANEREHPQQEREVVDKYVRTFAIDTKFEEDIHSRFAAGSIWIVNPAAAEDVVAALRRPEARDEFFRQWWPSHITAPGNFLMGAGAMRAKGRLAYYLGGAGIAQTIAAEVNNLRRVRDAGSGRAGEDLPVYVVVVGSLSGGTGSGILLTLALHIRELVTGNVQMIGAVPTASIMSLAPAKFMTENVWANASAGLRELEWFMTPPSLRQAKTEPFFRLAAQGETVQGDGSRGRGMPFDLCYLFTRNNRVGKNLASHDEYTRLIADCVTLDVNSSVSDKAQAMISNVMPRITMDVRPSGSKRAKPVRFGSAGVSSLAYPARDIQRFLGLRLVASLLDHFFLTPEDIGAAAANWAVANNLEERGTYNQVHDDLRSPHEDATTRQTLRLPPKPSLMTQLDGTNRSTVRQAFRGVRAQFDNNWLQTLTQLVEKNRGVLIRRHRDAIWKALMDRLRGGDGEGFEHMAEFAKALRTVLLVNRDDVDAELNKPEVGRRDQLRQLEEQLSPAGTKARGPLHELEAAHGLFALPGRVKSARERFVTRWWSKYVDHRDNVVAGEAVVKIYDELLQWLNVVIEVLADTTTALGEEREDAKRKALAQLGVRRQDALVLEERVLDDARLVEAHFRTSIDARSRLDSNEALALAKSAIESLAPMISGLVDAPPPRAERRRALVGQAVRSSVSGMLESAERLFEPEVSSLSIWDALENEYLLRRELGLPDEYMRDIKSKGKRSANDEVTQYITNRVQHTIAASKPFWQLDPARTRDNPEFQITLDGMVAYASRPFDDPVRASLGEAVRAMAVRAGLSPYAGDGSIHRVTVAQREVGAPLFMLHPNERDQLLAYERTWTAANGHVYIDERFRGVLPPDFDLGSLSVDDDDFSLPLAIAFHFGHLRYAPGANGANRGSIERADDPESPVWRPFAPGIVRAVERLHDEPGERAEFQEMVEEAWQGVSQADRKKHLRQARQWVASELGEVRGKTISDQKRRSAFESMKRALDSELAG